MGLERLFAYCVFQVKMKILGSLATIASVIADECSLFQAKSQSLSEVDDGTVGVSEILYFCNDRDICDSTNPTQGDYSSEAAVRCANAHNSIHALELQEVDERFGSRPMPESLLVEQTTIVDTITDDREFFRIEKSKLVRLKRKRPHSNKDSREDAMSRWDEREYPRKFQARAEELESLLQLVVRQLRWSYPRPTSLENLDIDWIPEIISKIDALEADDFSENKRAVSIFRNHAVMREYSWYIHAIMHFSLKQRDEAVLSSFLSGAAPFLFVFTYTQAKLGIHYVKQYDWGQNFLATLSHLKTPIAHIPWHILLYEGTTWFNPELLMLTSALVSWNQVLTDAEFNRPPTPPGEVDMDRIRQFRYNFLSGMLDVLLETATNSMFDDMKESSMIKASLAFNYLDAKAADVGDICEKHSEKISLLVQNIENIPEPIGYQTIMSILGRCKPFLTLQARVTALIEPIGVYFENVSRMQIWISESGMPGDIITRLANLDAYHMGGHLVISYISLDGEASQVPGGKMSDWFPPTLSRVFEEGAYFKSSMTDSGCTYFEPAIGNSKSLDDLKFLRGIGRLIGLYIREGFDLDILRRYMTPCPDRLVDKSVSEVMFFGSHYIRKGVYDIFVDCDFERTLLNGAEVDAMLQLLQISENSRFFRSGPSRVITV